MLVICDGAPKSGSTFLFKLIKAILAGGGRLDHLGNDPEFLNSTLINNDGLYIPSRFIDNEAVNIINSQVKLDFVIKSHLYRKLTLDTSHYIFCTVRDPIDNALSLYEQHKKESTNSKNQQRFQDHSLFLVSWQ